MEVVNAIGRRKSAVARVYVSEGTGKIIINKKELEVYFPSAILQYVVKQPLNLLEVAEKYDGPGCLHRPHRGRQGPAGGEGRRLQGVLRHHPV